MECDINQITRLEVAEETLKNKIWIETKKLWIVAGPAILIRFSIFGINVISQAFIGHVGSTELAAYGLVFIVLFRFVLGILIGMSSGFGTLCGQAYGAKQYHKLGIYLQQSWIVMLTTSTLLSPLFIFGAPILKALGQDERIAKMAGTIALWFIPSFLYYYTSLSWLLIVKYKFGVPGVMVSTILVYMVTNLGQLIYVMTFGGCRETWRGLTTLALKDLGLGIKLSVSSGVMICLEYWYNTVLILLTGNMENAMVTIGALSICLNISGWAQMIFFGLLAAASVIVSNELGKRDAKAAKCSVVMIVVTSFAIAMVLYMFLLLFSGRVSYMFTKSQDVAKKFVRFSPHLAFSVLLNGVQLVLSGVANGAGRQGIVACVTFVCNLIGIPLGVLLGYVFKLKVEGVWTGMIIGTAIQTAILVIMTCRTDWNKQVTLTQIRINRRSVEAETINRE